MRNKHTAAVYGNLQNKKRLRPENSYLLCRYGYLEWPAGRAATRVSHLTQPHLSHDALAAPELCVAVQCWIKGGTAPLMNGNTTDNHPHVCDYIYRSSY